LQAVGGTTSFLLNVNMMKIEKHWDLEVAVLETLASFFSQKKSETQLLQE
jgi:hypothetical protein